MNVIAPFGFVTGCHAGDKFMVQATLASMRHFCPTIPICLTVDGNFDVSDLEKEYNLIILRVSDLPTPEMRKLTSKSFHAKLAAMWEGPFEFYVWMDSDAIVWGDFTTQVRRDLDFQIFARGSERVDDSAETVPDWLPHYFFDPNLLKEFDSDFKWQGNIFFCAGVYACRRDLIPFKEWEEVFSWGLWKNTGDQGLLNYLVHAKAQKGEIKIKSADLQHIWILHGKQELIKDCEGYGWHFPNKIRRPRIAHFCYRKPFLFDRIAYSRPFTIARLEHHRRQHSELGAWLQLLNEDRRVIFGKIDRRLKRVIR